MLLASWVFYALPGEGLLARGNESVPVKTATAADETSASSPFVGTYSGPFSFRSLDSRFVSGEGTITVLTISTAGHVTGEFKAPGDVAGEITGFVDDDGGFRYTIEFSNQTYVVKGTATKTKKGHLKATLTQYRGKDQPVGTVEFDLPPK
jgi:hypothetical protein